jgi:hypothetical protein
LGLDLIRQSYIAIVFPPMISINSIRRNRWANIKCPIRDMAR